MYTRKSTEMLINKLNDLLRYETTIFGYEDEELLAMKEKLENDMEMLNNE